MPQTDSLTAREMIVLSDLIRMESSDLQKVRAVLPFIGDADLRGLLEGCAHTGQTHLKELAAFAKENGLSQ